MLPFRCGPPSLWFYGQPKLTLSGVGLLRWMISLSLAASGAFMLRNQTHSNSETIACPAHDLRIYGGESSFDGAVLIPDTSGHWRRLCFGVTVDILIWTGINGAARLAEVICRQVGIPQFKASAVFYKYNSEELRHNYTDFLFYFPLRCDGDESHLSQCHPYNMEFKEPDIKESQIRDECYFGVACQDDDHFNVSVASDEWTRNVLASLESTGFVRAGGLLNAKSYGWMGRVCTNSYDSVNRARIAQISCRQMGYRTGFAIRAPLSDNDDGSSPFAIINGSQTNRNCLMPQTICSGGELSISDCEHWHVWGSFTPELIYDPRWPGYPVPIACTDTTEGTFEVKTGLQLNISGSSPTGVFIKYGTMWLPVINSTDPFTCNTVCKSLDKQRQTKAICHQEALDDGVLRNVRRYVASIHCNHEESDVHLCTHLIELLYYENTSNLNDHIRPQHLQVLCLEIEEHKLYNIALSVVADARVSHSGCLVANINGTVRNVFAAKEETKQTIARIACKNYHPERNLTLAVATIANYLHEDEHWKPFSQNFACPAPSVYIGCGSNHSAASDCTYNLRNKNPDVRWIYTESLMVFCAYGTLELHLTANFTPYDGRLEFRFENGRAFVDMEGWNDAASAVACRHLGFGNKPSRGIRKVLSHRGMEWIMVNVTCNGTEELLTLCAHKWMPIPVRYGINVAGVICRATGSHFNVELVMGDSNSGQVAIKRKSDSIYICPESNPDDSRSYREFLAQAGILLCRNAGLLRTKNAERLHITDNQEQLPDSTLAFKNFVCKDSNSLLEECTHDGAVELASCFNEFPIAPVVQQRVLTLRCEEYEFGTMVRLVGGKTPFEGHVEVMYKGQWGAVCDDRFDTDSSSVICRQLFGSASEGHPVPGSQFATKNERFLLDEVRCSAEAKNLAECSHNQWGDHDCGQCEQAGVICHEVLFIRQPTVFLKVNGANMQLVCSAEGFPSPSYQWFSTGLAVSVSGDSIDIRCNDSETISYICNAYNSAGELFVQVTIEKMLGCFRNTPDAQEYIAQFDKSVMPTMAVGLCVSTLGFIGVLLYALSLRRTITKVTRSEKDISGSVAYSTMNLVNEPS